MRRLSFRLKLLGVSAVALASLAGLLTLAQSESIDRALNGQLVTNADQHRPFFVAAFSGPLLTRDYASVRAIVEESVGENRLSYLLVKDSGGRVVAVRGWDTTKAPIPPPGLAPVADPKGRLVVPFEADIRVAGQRLGSVCFGLSYEHVADAKRRALLVNIAIALGAFLVIVLLIELLTVRLTRPLASLANASDQIGAGNFDIEPPPARHDEFGRLAAAFYRMSQEIKQRIATLTASEEAQRR
ncbi:MAG: HAMP domain-containing protein, partial [Rhodospirillaceae bacterium]|nr:HAMP domain-containing protein [Rhodospirillaceae bacterium]